MVTLDLQSTTYDCGPVALRGGLQLLGRQVTLRDLTRWAGTTPAKGTPAAGLKRALERVGVTFREYASKSRLQAWKWTRRISTPALLSFDDDEHWVLLCASVGRTVIIFDPEVGLQVYARKDFLNRWTAGHGRFYALQLAVQ